jgi:putative ABC transport system ATP-binding protein
MLIRLQNIVKEYRIGEIVIPALRDVTIDIDRGEFVAVTGASGSGKSTLLNVLGCLDCATSGKYLLDSEDITSLNADELADIRNRRIGFVFQNFNLLPRTSALENVELPLYYGRPVDHHTRRARAREMLDRLGLADRHHHHPSQLSGGQQQRVAIARALVNRPALILADEPTGNLDSKSGHEIMALFRELNADGITVVMVTHDPAVAGQARRAIRMQDGEVV